MSTSTISDRSKDHEDNDLIVRQVSAAQGRIRSTDVVTAAVTCGILVTCYVLVFTIADHWLIPGGFSPWARATLLAAVLIGVMFLAWRHLIGPLSKSVTALYAARTLDNASASGGALLSLVDLKEAGVGTSERVHRTIEDRARTHLLETSLDDAIDRSQLVRMGLILFGLVLLTCLYAVLSPKPISLLRPLTLMGQEVATRTRITNVSPGETTISLGERVPVTVDISGVIPESVQLLYTTADQRDLDAVLTMEPFDENGRYTAVITGDEHRGIRQSTSYVIQAGDARSNAFTISVDMPPTATVRELRYQFPKYTQLPDTASINPNIDVWEGTTVTVFADATVPVVESWVELCPSRSFQADVTRHPMIVTDRELTAEFELKEANADNPIRFYRITVQGSRGTRDPSPTVYTVNIQPDALPVVELKDPAGDLHVAANATVPLLIYASDPDFLLRSVTLNYSIQSAVGEHGDERIFDGDDVGFQKTWSGTYDFELASLNLQAGDVVSYVVRALDNRHPRGPAAHTQVQNLHILGPASPEQLKDDLKTAQERQERMLNHLREDHQQTDDGAGREHQDANDSDRTENGTETANDKDVREEEGSEGQDTGVGAQPESAQQGAGQDRSSTTQKNDGPEKSGSESTGETQGEDNKTTGSQSENRKPMDEEEAIQKIVEEYLNDPDRAREDQKQNTQTNERVSKNPGSRKEGGIQSGADQSEKDESVNDRSDQRESGQRESGQRESGQGESDQGESGQGESGQGESAQGESGQGESGQGESGQGESGQGESGQ
ncbi:MAG: hypothetical protein MK102_10125, partial [Fuerstiella sp.]|nr:hypothetical protein [Fuerstiella sp.]